MNRRQFLKSLMVASVGATVPLKALDIGSYIDGEMAQITPYLPPYSGFHFFNHGEYIGWDWLGISRMEYGIVRSRGRLLPLYTKIGNQDWKPV